MQGSCQPRRPPLLSGMPRPFLWELATRSARSFRRRIGCAIGRRRRHQIVTFPANCCQSPLAMCNPPWMRAGDTELAYRMIAERDNETVKVERTSSIVIVAKARIWASEGWQVVITDADGKSYAVAEFDQLLAA